MAQKGWVALLLMVSSISIASAISIYVSPEGSDDGAGTLSDPFATLHRAQQAVRNAPGNEVILLPGVFYLASPLIFDAQDSGTLWKASSTTNLSYVSGGILLAEADIVPVTDASILAQLPNDAKNHVLQYDLNKGGIGDLGQFSVTGSVNGNARLILNQLKEAGIELFFDSEAGVPARFPNTDGTGYGWTTVGAVSTSDNLWKLGISRSDRGATDEWTSFEAHAANIKELGCFEWACSTQGTEAARCQDLGVPEGVRVLKDCNGTVVGSGVCCNGVTDDIMSAVRESAVEFEYAADVASRVSRWRAQLSSPKPDIWAHGFWAWRWADAQFPVTTVTQGASVQPRTSATERVLSGTMSVAVPATPPDRTEAVCSGDCVPKEGGAYFLFNLLAELDTPGEYYLNRTSAILYFWPPSSSSSPVVSALTHVVTMSGTKNVQWLDIHIRHGRGAGILLDACSNVSILGGSVAHVGMMAINITQGRECLVKDTHIFSTGTGGVFLSGGDRVTLEAAGHNVTDANLQHTNRRVFSMCPSVFLGGVGQRLQGSQVSYHPQNAIWVQGNDHTVQGNDIHHVCDQALDSGALYSGRDWTYRGNQVLDNNFHDINSRYGDDVNAVYLDDMMSGWYIANNTFRNTSFAFQLGGGRENSFVGNIVDTAPRCGVSFDDRGHGWAKGGCHPGGLPYDFLSRVPYATSPAWRKYGHLLANITEDDPCTPKYNTIDGNHYCHLSTWITATPQQIAEWNSEASDNTPC